MRLSLFFWCISAGQSFVSRSLAVTAPRLLFSSSTKQQQQQQQQRWKNSLFSLMGGSSAERRRSSSTKRFAGTTLTTSSLENSTATTVVPSKEEEEIVGPTKILADANDFIKPDRDRHDYRYIQLANNLQVLLVSTGKSSSTEEKTAAKVEAASVHIQAGHFDDTIPGLAHFHEHMLFLGTEKYPDEDEYEAFLSKYGGFGNAYTDMEDTNYYFSVTTQHSDPDKTSEGLEGGLDRLAQFFISPTFKESMVEREMRAIDSEYRNGKTNDAWRNFQFMKAISNQKHPFSKFGCGNYETLTQNGGAPVEELKNFWKTYYKTSNMRLAVVGRSSLDALQATVEKTFGKIPYSNDPPRHVKENPKAPFFKRENAVYDPDTPAFGKEQLGKMREIIPLLEARSLKVQFLTPPLDDPVLKRTKPYRVLSHLLGHESPGSLHHLLNELGYLTGLTSGSAIDTSDFSLFSVTLSLTPKGMDNKEEVLDLIFQWIALIKKTALEQPELISEYHNELRQISKTNFKFRENGDPTDFCSSAADLMFDEVTPPTNILFASSMCEDYDPVIAEAFLERFRPDNAMVTITDSGLKKDEGEEWKVEPLYGATYRESDIPAEMTEKWGSPIIETDPRLQIPGLNKYIPTDFSLRCDDECDGQVRTQAEIDSKRRENPVLVNDVPNFRMWHKMDSFWRVPKTFVRMSIVSPVTYDTPRSMTLSRIYQRVLNDDLNSFVYDASLAGCNYRVSCAPTGYKMSVRGYSEKLPSLFETLTARMLSLIEELREGKEAHPGLSEKFERAKENLLRETRNYKLDTPYEIANYNSRLIMEENVWFLDNYVDLMEGRNADIHPLTMEDCADVAEECLTGRLKVNALCIGNIDKEGTRKITDVISRNFVDRSTPLHDAEAPKFKSLKLPTKEEAAGIFGPGIESESVPVKYQELAYSSSEENNAVEVTFQVGSDFSLGYAGIGILDLIAHFAYNSAYNQLRTKEQLGYIVSAFTRKTAGGAWGLTVVVQSSAYSPTHLEERVEAWLKIFREELEAMPTERVTMEAQAIVAQLKEDETKLSQEVGFVWNEIVATETCNEKMSTPAFDRLDRLADELTLKADDQSETTLNGNPRKSAEDLKKSVLEMFDQHIATEGSHRRAMSSRVFTQANRDEYESCLHKPGVLSTYSEMRFLKEFLSSWPVAPYWRVVDGNAADGE